MKQFLQILIGIGFLNLFVGGAEMISNTKLSGSMIIAHIFILAGFIGLFINKKLKSKINGNLQDLK